MKALVVVRPGRLELRDVSRPVPGPREALVKIDACGICGTTDRELVAGTQPYHNEYPAILGHESTGVVVEVGPECRKFKVGDRVTRPAAIIAGDHRDGLASCWGGFAEYGLVRDPAPGAVPDYQEERELVVDSRLRPEQAVLAISLAGTVILGTGLSGRSGRISSLSPIQVCLAVFLSSSLFSISCIRFSSCFLSSIMRVCPITLYI